MRPPARRERTPGAVWRRRPFRAAVLDGGAAGPGPGPDARDPQPLGRVARELAKTRGWSAHVAEGTVLGQWPTVVGHGDRRPLDRDRPQRWRAERGGGIHGVGDAVAGDAGPDAGQNRRGRRQRCGDVVENYRPGLRRRGARGHGTSPAGARATPTGSRITAQKRSPDRP